MRYMMNTCENEINDIYIKMDESTDGQNWPSAINKSMECYLLNEL